MIIKAEENLVSFLITKAKNNGGFEFNITASALDNSVICFEFLTYDYYFSYRKILSSIELEEKEVIHKDEIDFKPIREEVFKNSDFDKNFLQDIVDIIKEKIKQETEEWTETSTDDMKRGVIISECKRSDLNTVTISIKFNKTVIKTQKIIF